MKLPLPLAFALLGASCASWTDSDARWASDVAKTASTALGLCAEDDAGCDPARVRALETAQLCEAQATIARHKLPGLGIDGGCR